jgi:hypothetical protein
VPLGLVLGWLTWCILWPLAWIDGSSSELFSLSVIGGHARLLVVIPLFFLCESLFGPRAAAFVNSTLPARIVARQALPALEAAVARTVRWKDAWQPEAVCLVAAVLLSLAAPRLNLPGETAHYDAGRAAAGFSLVGWWYWGVALTLFRFLMFRWLWRLGLWCHFLWRVSRLELVLIPTHPDRAAGLGTLASVHNQFASLVMAISVVGCASFAESIAAGTMTVAETYPALIVILIADAVLFVGPLLVFVPKLLACRTRGMSAYMGLAARYVGEFDRKWLGTGANPKDELLGSPDLQSLADLSNSVNVVRTMHWVPMSQRLLTGLGTAALLPMLPLLLFEYPAAELARRVFSRLVGF